MHLGTSLARHAVAFNYSYHTHHTTQVPQHTTPHHTTHTQTHTQTHTTQRNTTQRTQHTHNTPRGKVGSSGLQAEHGETWLVRWLRAGPCAGDIQTTQSIGNSLGLGVKQVRAGGIHSYWVENRTSFAFSGPISRNQVVLECRLHTMLWDDQGVSA